MGTVFSDTELYGKADVERDEQLIAIRASNKPCEWQRDEAYRRLDALPFTAEERLVRRRPRRWGGPIPGSGVRSARSFRARRRTLG